MPQIPQAWDRRKRSQREASASTPVGLSSCSRAQEGTPSITDATLENNNWASCWAEPAPQHRAGRAPALGASSKASAWAEDMLAAGWIGLKGSGEPPPRRGITSTLGAESRPMGSLIHFLCHPNVFIICVCHGMKKLGSSAP